MAKEKTVKLEVKTNIDDVAKGFEKTQKEIKKTEGSIKDLDKSVEKLDKTLDKTGDKLEKSQKRAQKSFKGTRKEVDKTDQKLKGVKGGLDGVSAGFETAEGAMSLFGAESETAGVAVEKLRDGMDITSGIESMNKGYKLMQKWGVISKIAAAGQWLWSAAVGGTSGAMKILRIALISTGIGALVVGVGLLIANFDKVKRTVKQLFKRFKFLKLAFLPLIATIKLVREGLKLLGMGQKKNAELAKNQAKWAEEEAKREEQRFKDKMDRLDKEATEQKRLAQLEIDIAKAKGKNTDAAEKDILEKDLQAIKDKSDREKAQFEESARYTLDSQKEQIANKKAALKIIEKLEKGSYGERVERTYQEEGILRNANLSRMDSRREVLKDIGYLEKQHTKFMEKETKKWIKVTETDIEASGKKIELFDANKQAEKIAAGKQWSADRIAQRRKIQDLETDLMAEGIEKELEQNRIKHERLLEDMKGTAAEKKKLNDIYTTQQEESAKKIREKYAEKQKEEVKKFFKLLSDFWDAYDEARDDANEKRIEKQDAMDELELELMADTLENQNLLIAKSYEDRFLIAEGNVELTKQLNAQMNADISANNKKHADKDKADAHTLAMAKADIALQGLQLIAGIAESMAGDNVKKQKRAFQIKKVADIASATMDGYKAVLSTFAETPGGPVLKGIAAGIAGAFAALQIANIAKAKFEGGDPGGLTGAEPGAVGGGAVTPEFNIVGDSGINDLEGLGAPPLQAYVTSQDVTSAQGLDRARIENATI